MIWKSKRKKSGGVLFIVNSLAALFLILAHFSPWINPGSFFWAGVLGLSLPFWVLINLFFVVYWAYRFQRKIMVPVIALVLSYGSIKTMFQASGKHEENSESLHLMTYNVRLFNKYQWIEDAQVDQKQVALINNNDPDLLALQEFHQGNEAARKLHFPYRQVELIRPDKNYGLAIYSRYPILASQLLNMGEATANAAMFCDILYKEDTLRVYNVHLASLRLGASDYAFLDQIERGNQDGQLKEGTQKILRSLKLAYQQRVRQLEILLNSIGQSPHPVIVMGDFNDIPQSYCYDLLSENFKDSFMEAGFGWGKTYTKYLPSFRIDYVFVPSDWEVYSHKVHNEDVLSDHYPISSKVGMLP